MSQAEQKIQAYNCQRPVNIHQYQRKTVCNEDEMETSERKQFTIVQKAKVQYSTGWRCEVLKSTWVFRCGAWGHLKLARIPQVAHSISVSPQWCSEMVSRRKFKVDQSGQSFQLDIDRVNIITVTEAGELKETNDKITCTGQQLRTNGVLHTNVVELAEYKVTIRTEQYHIKDNQLEAVSSHLTLPCKVNTFGCVTGTGTYTYDPVVQKCPLQRVRDIAARKVMQTYLLDDEAQLLLNQTGKTRIPGCTQELITTDYDDLYIMEPNQASTFPMLRAEELEMDREVKLLGDYLNFRLEDTTRDLKQGIDKGTCESTTDSTTPIQIRDEVFAFVKGDLYFSFKCQKTTVVVAERSKCYTDIPVEGDFEFADSVTRVLKHHSTIVPCNHHFPLTVKTMTNWIELSPHIKIVPEPQANKHRPKAHIRHKSFVDGGLYTNTELINWENLLNFPTYQKALLTGVSLGSCIKEGQCQEESGEVRTYDFDRLIPGVMEKLDFMATIRKWIETNGAYLSAGVIVLVAFKILVDVTLITLTLVKEGPRAAAAMLVALYWNSRHQMRTIQRRNQREQERRNRANKRLTEEEYPMNEFKDESAPPPPFRLA